MLNANSVKAPITTIAITITATNSLGSFTNGWCSKSYKQGMENEPLTKPLKLAATVTIRASGSRSEMIMGSNKYMAPSDGLPMVKKHLKQEGNPVY